VVEKKMVKSTSVFHIFAQTPLPYRRRLTDPALQAAAAPTFIHRFGVFAEFSGCSGSLRGWAVPSLACPTLQDPPQQTRSDYPVPDSLLFCFTGTDDLQITVTPTPESFPHGKLSPISPTWPFSEVQSSSAAGRVGTVPGLAPDNTSLPQLGRTPSPKAHRRARAHGDFSPPPAQGSGRSTSLKPSKESTESLVPPRAQGGEAAAAVSGLPRTSMVPRLSTLLSVTPLRAVLVPQPLRVGTPSISKHRSPRSDILLFLPPSSPSSLTPASSPHFIVFSKPAEPPTQEPLFPATAPMDFSSRSVADALHPFADAVEHAPSPRAQGSIGTPHLGFSGSSTEQYSELSSPEDARSAGSPTPVTLQSGTELAHVSPPHFAPGSLLQLPGRTPSRPLLEVTSSPASTQPVEAEVAESVHHGVSLPAFKSTVAVPHEAEPPLFQPADSVAVEMTSRKLAPAIAGVSANPLHLSAAPENSEGPSLSAEHTSLVSSSLPLTTPSLSGAVPGSPLDGLASNLPSTLPSFRSTQNPVSPPPDLLMSPPQEDSDRPPPMAATDFLLLLKSNHRSTTRPFPLQKEDSTTADSKKKEKTEVTVTFQTLPAKEIPSLLTINGFTSELSTGRFAPTVITPPRMTLRHSPLPVTSISSGEATQTVAQSPSFSSSKSETSAAAPDPNELPVSASKQVTAFPSSTEVYDFSTMEHMKKPEITDVFWSSLLAETGSLSTEAVISGLLQQTNYDVNRDTINSTSWETHSISTTPPPDLTSAVSTIKAQDLKDTAGHLATADGFSIQDPVLGASIKQPIQQSVATIVGNHTDFLSISSNNHSRDFQAPKVEDYPSTSQFSVSHPHPAHPLSPTSPSLTSTASMQEMFADGKDASFPFPSDTYPSPMRTASTTFQSILKHHFTAEPPLLSTSALFRNPSKVPLASQHPKKWTGDSSVSSKGEPTAAAATLFVKKSSLPALSAALVAKGTGGSPSAVASGLVKSTALAKNVTNSAASGSKVTPGAGLTAFSFTPTYMFARTSHAVSTHTAMQGNTGTASGLLSTTHLPRKPQAMHPGLLNPTNPDMARVSTTRPLTITAALTSVTAPVRATRLPPVLAGNTDAALPAVSTAVVTTGKTASSLECQMSTKLLVRTVLFLTQRRAQFGESLKLSVARGLTQALRKAFHQNDVSAHVSPSLS
ncbi:UPF0606 protein, partial [Galemys pyrenaicus]